VTDELRVEVSFKPGMSSADVSDAELDLLQSVLPDLMHLAQRFDDSDDD
jgi:hypothetical protein